MKKVRRALQVLLCVASSLVIQLHAVNAGETPPSQESPAVNAAPPNDTQREWREKLRRPAPAGSGTALFETKSWLPPPPPPAPRTAVRAPEVRPTPPPFPYQFLGRLEMEGKPGTVYLTKDNQVYSVAPGEVIEGTYRVVGVTGESIEVTYLPLNMTQHIAFSTIVPAVGRPAGRSASDTPAIVAPTTAPVPPPMNLSPPVASPMGQTATPESPRAAQRSNVPDPSAANRGGGAAPQQAGAAPSTGTAAATAGGAPATPPSLSPSPVVVSPPTLSVFGSPAPADGGATGAKGPAGVPPAPQQSGADLPNAPPSGRM